MSIDGSHDAGDAPAWTPRDDAPDRAAVCQCGAPVDPELARVLGDNDGRVAACRECSDPGCGDAYEYDASAAVAALHDRGGTGRVPR